MKQDFKSNSLDTNTQVLANYLPVGDLYASKNISDSNLRKLLASLAQEFTREQNKLYELSTEYKVDTTVNLLDIWESALGIPDDCFTNDVSIEQRQKQVLAKLAKMNLNTEQDWIDLAALFGYSIRIIHPIDYFDVSVFDYTFDFYFLNLSPEQLRFVMIIEFLGMEAPENTFDSTFDFTFSEDNNFMIRIFEKLKPADVKLVYVYELGMIF